MKKVSGAKRQKKSPPPFGERLLFAIWLSGKVLGAESAKQFAESIGKTPAQVSKWIMETPRPEWATIKRIADAVGVSALWLDEPTRDGAVEPEDFPEWRMGRVKRARRIADEAMKRAPAKRATEERKAK